jgi:hypothetical protein
MGHLSALMLSSDAGELRGLRSYPAMLCPFHGCPRCVVPEPQSPPFTAGRADTAPRNNTGVRYIQC